MKILLITHPECDYGAYFFYAGLRQLGIEVVDYPYKSIYHGKSCSYPIPWYGTDEMGHSSPPRFHRNWSGREYSESEIIKDIADFDLVVLESPRPIAVETLSKLMKKTGLPPIVMLDGEDYDYVHEELVTKFDVELVFKRELSFQSKNVWSFPFSSYIIGDGRYQFDDSEKELDVFFVAGNTHPSRMLVSKTLKEIVKKHGYKAVIALDNEPSEPLVDHTFRFKESAHRLGLEGYLESTARAKIAVSVRGYGRDTIRVWEIPSYRTLLLSDDLQKLGLIYSYPFTHRENAVFFKPDCSDLEEMLVYYLENEGERVKVAKAGHRHLKQYHTNQARAKYFVERVEKLGL